jgi:hypothetical protein
LLTFNSSLAYFIQAWAELETSIGAIARVKEFTWTVLSELVATHTEPRPHWPDKGNVAFTDAAEDTGKSLIDVPKIG